MILSELLDMPVRCEDVEVGRVVDVRFVLAGAAEGPLAQPELLGLVVGRHRGAFFLGYERRSTNGPAVLNRYFAWRQRDTFLVDWEDVANVSKTVELTPGFTRWSPQL